MSPGVIKYNQWCDANTQPQWLVMKPPPSPKTRAEGTFPPTVISVQSKPDLKSYLYNSKTIKLRIRISIVNVSLVGHWLFQTRG